MIQTPLMVENRNRIIALAARHRLPAVYPLASFADAGGLVSYGVNLPPMWRDAAVYIDRILRGANPAELPIQEPSEPEIVINLRTARELGLVVPSTLRASATRIIDEP